MSDPLPDDLMRKYEDWLRDHPQLDPESHRNLLEVAEAWRGWKTLGRFLRAGVVIAGTVAAGLLAWDQFWAKVRSLLSP